MARRTPAFSAIAEIGGRVRLTGFIAWLAWLFIHIVYLIGFKNRVTTLLHWFVSFIGRGRAERAITTQQVFARTAMRRLEEVERTLPEHAASHHVAPDHSGATRVDASQEAQRAS